ncbi:response regulator [Azospirillum halopraeferens]|uniref:response regulator n=1 Tax=Azospirillum halopraeferens TaxID=34010 RepID=UPI0004222AD0|nr:response regulator [Azospirillum halopraeferens]
MSARILIVEDEALVALSLRALLSDGGYEVVGVEATGAGALACAAATRPDLALMDIRLAGPMDGIDTAAALRAQFAIAIVYVSAQTDALTARRAEATHPLGFVVKPFVPRDLLTAVAGALDRSAPHPG